MKESTRRRIEELEFKLADLGRDVDRLNKLVESYNKKDEFPVNPIGKELPVVPVYEQYKWVYPTYPVVTCNCIDKKT